ncbi:heat-shock protein Hsp20 [Vulcanibacillus modesticaldus]|uniref:Heat-shock protein Hsp20 n=1 Tax=Vulcanibacillus modesticaldus TaxID=337097 RepID=A0A1D2YW59_9BACI|nr:Hsp20/alpha crystallin family protein [Vulcanibacillus modesticaldus]OEF99964.1 heat-shock protein Hsp20 [Vulcanibacillus modesticaldus]
MSLIPYEPIRHLENMRKEFDKFFANNFLNDFYNRLAIPRIDMYEADNKVVVQCDLPGLENKEDVKIEVDGNLLSIKGNIKRANEIKEEHLHRKERFYGSFQRSITLPSDVDPDMIKATYKNGVLEISIPKKPSEKSRKIDIEFH